MKLSEFVYPDVNAARSINLERDRGRASALEEYQVTAKACEIIARLVSGLRGERVSAWSLTGPYGMGKSAFANFLVAITGHAGLQETKLAYRKLQAVDQGLQQDLAGAIRKKTSKQGFFRVPITAAYEPVNRTLISGFLRALGNGQLDSRDSVKLRAVASALKRLSQKDHADSQTIAEYIKSIEHKLRRPVIIVVDEFGKNLEYMAHHPDKGDIFIMQVLAETAGIFLWVCLHQAFEGYASGLTAQQRQEWNKVQGRFEDISFVESTSQMLALARRVLVQRPKERLSTPLRHWASRMAEQIQAAKLANLESMTEEEISSLYPLNPLSAVVLPELCRRFAQNDRTLFSFLCSGDPCALPEYLRNHEINRRMPSLGIYYLYDYFFSVSTTAFVNRPKAQRWVEIQHIVGQANILSPLSQAILKTVGVLNLISGPFGVPSTSQVLLLAVMEPFGTDQNTVEKEISALLDRKILIYREYARQYRLWEGSDFDVVGAIHEKRASIAARPLVETLQSYCPQIPIIASRHSYQKGTVRRFECRWMEAEDLIANTPKPQEGYDGLLVYAFGRKSSIKDLPVACSDGRPLLIAYAPHENQVRELALEAAAAKIVLNETPELVHDGVARKEARFRLQAAENQLRDYIEKIYAPKSEDTKWYAIGERRQLNSYRDLSGLISDLCDEAYRFSPRIGNEMINCENLSSAAARARRELSEAMVTREGQAQLGLTGFGPEVAVYLSLFRATRLHIPSDGKWAFVRPEAIRNPELAAVWEELDRLLAETQDNPEGIGVRILIDRLKEPPFGMREGPIPLLLCHYLIVNQDEIALYQEGAYKPYFGEAEITLMIKRPGLFSMRRYAPTGLSRNVVQAYLEVLNTDVLRLDERIRNPSLLKIVAPLLRFVEGLYPQYARFTRRVSVPTQIMRAAILNSREPIELLFRDIPESLGIHPLHDNSKADRKWKKDLRDRLQAALLELQNAFGRLSDEVQGSIIEAFGFDAKTESTETVRAEVRKRLLPLVARCRDQDLKPIIAACTSVTGDVVEWAHRIAGQSMKKPVDSWRDTDVEPFRAVIFDASDRIEALSAMVAAGLGLEESDGLVITLTRANGRPHRQVIRLNNMTRNNLKHNFAGVLDQPRETRGALCALLSESLEKEG